MDAALSMKSILSSDSYNGMDKVLLQVIACGNRLVRQLATPRTVISSNEKYLESVTKLFNLVRSA